MMKDILRAALFVAMVLGGAAASSADLSGSYVAQADPGTTMLVREAADGVVTGTVADATTSLPLDAIRNGDGFTGTLGPSGASLPVTALADGNSLILIIGSALENASLVFVRARAVPGAAASNPGSASGNTGDRRIVINGHPLSTDELAALEGRYQTRLTDAEYWYDPILGAWGIVGGPTRGFALAGLSLGGSLQPGASGGGTQVFVNGRELHPYDVLVLQQITGPIAPGRYFITSQGLAGFEGGPPLWNLTAMAAQSQGGSSWQSRLSSGFSDGTTGAVFLPNGGIVSTGE